MQTGETETTEYKKSLAELKQGIISLAAMLNKHGEAVCGLVLRPMASCTIALTWTQ